MSGVNENLDDYVANHTTAAHPYLHQLYRATHTQLIRPRMASGPLQGRLLTMLCQMHQPQTVVEIGTYSGYSALSMAAGMPRGSVLHTFEINDEQEDFTRPWLENSPWSKEVDITLAKWNSSFLLCNSLLIWLSSMLTSEIIVPISTFSFL